LSNGFLNSLNRLTIDLLTYLYYVTSLLRQFYEIYTLKHKSVGSRRHSTETAMKRLQRSQQLLEPVIILMR